MSAADLLYRQDAYLQEARAKVLGYTPEGGILLDRTVFYPTGGGQPGDNGWLEGPQGRIAIATAMRVDGGQVALVPADMTPLPPIGAEVYQRIDWHRRHRYMRMHTAVHLLSVVIPLPITGSEIGADRSRIEFAMAMPPSDLAPLNRALSLLVERDLPVGEEWVSPETLAANPGLIKTMSVVPPMGQGPVRLVRIGDGAAQVDLQPCGGTHVARTGEIGRIEIVKVESKGRDTRRVIIAFA